MPTKWQQFVSRWKEGCGSSLCREAKHVCLARGTVPCEVLFVGEAPSVGADVIGQPFVGEVRLVLDEIMKQAMLAEAKCAFTNLVGCIPRSKDGGSKAVRQPPDEAIRACQPRLTEFIELCEPKLIIAVGRLAEAWLPTILSEHATLRSIPVVYIVHPSHIRHIRQTPHNSGYRLRKAVETLRKAIEEHVIGTPQD